VERISAGAFRPEPVNAYEHGVRVEAEAREAALCLESPSPTCESSAVSGPAALSIVVAVHLDLTYSHRVRCAFFKDSASISLRRRAVRSSPKRILL
jgi:hypothetical protein